MVLQGALYLLALRIKRHDLLDQVGLGVVRASHQVLGTGSGFFLAFFADSIDVVTHGCRGIRHCYRSLAHQVGALSSKAQRHTLLCIGVICRSSLLLRDFLRTVLFLLSAGEQVLLILLVSLCYLGGV